MQTIHLRLVPECTVGAKYLCGASAQLGEASWTVEEFVLKRENFAHYKACLDAKTHQPCWGCFPGKKLADDARWCAGEFLRIIGARIKAMREEQHG